MIIIIINFIFVFFLDVKNVVFVERNFVWNVDRFVFGGESGFGWVNGLGVWEEESNGFKVEWVVEECCVVSNVEEFMVFCKIKLYCK